MIRTESVLRCIWQGDVRPGDCTSARGFARAFQEIVQVRPLPLRLAGEGTPLVMAEDAELMPGLLLGDVLAEELGLDVPYGTLVLLLPEAGPCAAGRTGLSRALGMAVAEALLLAVMRSGLPVDRQTDALYLCAHAAARITATATLHRRGVDRPAFGLGLAAGLAAFWRGGPASPIDEAALFARPDFLWSAELTGHLTRLDPAFTAPDPARIPTGLLRVSDGPTGLPLWVSRVEMAVRRELGATGDVPASASGITSRFNLQ